MESEIHSPAYDTDHLVVVSCDTHIGPKLSELRGYCERKYLGDFDEFCEEHNSYRGPFDDIDLFNRNQKTAGHHDFAARTHDMDYDGIASEVIFHGSQNNQPIPFRSNGSFGDQRGQDLGKAAIGNHIYNRWLGDFVARDPDRHIGLAHLPMWDIEAAISELEWARKAGLRSVNFPAMQAGILEYNRDEWEPFWAACEDLDMPLTTHSASSSPGSAYSGPELPMLASLESGGWYARRALHWMILGGVFERHPRLKLVLTEQPGSWWTNTLNEFDSVYKMGSVAVSAVHDRVPRLPSEYCRRNVFIGASFMSHGEAEAACREGYAENVLWGSDYPHVEGTYYYPDNPDDESLTRQSLRMTFSDIPEAELRLMIGENAIRVYGLDRNRLQAVAARIGAPTLNELRTPLTKIPDWAGNLAFRQDGPWS